MVEGYRRDLKAHVAHILVDQNGSVRHVTRAVPLQFESFSEGEEGEITRDTAGEYFPVIFRRDGSLAVVSTIQNPSGDRSGFTWRPIRLPQESEEPGGATGVVSHVSATPDMSAA